MQLVEAIQARAQLQQFIANRDLKTKQLIKQKLPELLLLEQLLLTTQANYALHIVGTIKYKNIELPWYRIDLGQAKAEQPRLLIVGGIHGIERIGARLVIALLQTWLQRLTWSKSLQQGLSQLTITFIPIMNPVGMLLNQRANGNGVDLMRNAPIDAEHAAFLVGGQQISRHFSWYRGNPEQLELENQYLLDTLTEITKNTEFLISLDCHSGFGFRDRIWFPYAYRRQPMTDIAPIVALKLLWEASFPNHQYVFEPQSNHYVTHGDFWDHGYKTITAERALSFIPLTLEMGSWRWVKKRPWQLFNLEGLFNPMVQHREQRVLRRHLQWFDFLRQACLSYSNWMPTPEQQQQLTQMANSLWYRD